jgi:hypothetical protein
MTARASKVPDWLLERLAAGELPENQANELRAALHERGEDARLAALAVSNAEILAALPPDKVVAAIERRAAARRQLPVRRPLLALSLAATCAAGLAVFLLVRPPGGRQPPSGSHGAAGPLVDQPGTTGYTGIKGDPSLRIHRKTRTGEESLRADATVRKGDTLQLGYVARGKRFGVIASVDGRGTFTLHLPESPGPAAALERGGERALPHAYELDDSPGFERFVFVTSDKPFATADVAAAVTSGRPLPAMLKVVELTLKKEIP